MNAIGVYVKIAYDITLYTWTSKPSRPADIFFRFASFFSVSAKAGSSISSYVIRY